MTFLVQTGQQAKAWAAASQSRAAILPPQEWSQALSPSPSTRRKSLSGRPAGRPYDAGIGFQPR